MVQSSKVFVSSRALGYVSNHVPCVTRFLKSRREHLVVTCIGKSFHTYSLNRLQLLSVSDQTYEDISCLSSDGTRIFTASGTSIHQWTRGTKIIQTYSGHSCPIHLLIPFGPHLIAVDESNTLKVWDRRSEELLLELEFDKNSFDITSIVHPSTYINKILIGSRQGKLQLWNLKTSKLIYSFSGWDSPITVLEQAPALDVIAVGLESGKIILHNLKYDECVMDLYQDWGAVTAINFRTDGPAIMATGSRKGHIVLWNLEEKKVASQILDAHNGPVSSLKCIPSEPLMVSSSPDNSVKVWIFDQSDMSGRLLRFREGHPKQPTCVRFYGSNNYSIISSGSDSSLRVFNLMNESGNHSLGKASYDKKKSKKKKTLVEVLKMPPIIEFTSELIREKEWDNIAAIHANCPLVTTWSYDKNKMGDHKLLPDRWSHEDRTAFKVTANTLSITCCGNFVVVGYSSGHVDRFNIQSGLHRCSYGSPVAHKGAVRGVIVDPLNKLVVSGCNKGLVKLWPFLPCQNMNISPNPLSRMKLGDGVTFFRMHKENTLLAVVLEDYSIVVVDLETKEIVRKFVGHSGQIKDATFSHDARWIITAAMDSTIRVWDLPMGAMIDWFKVNSPCVSLSMSPSGQYLATVHVNNRGIYLWANKTLFSFVALKPVNDKEDAKRLELPSATGAEGVIELEEEADEEPEKDEQVSQIHDLITLSSLPTSRWLNLLDLDLIKKRNKPKQDDSYSQPAPFFLPTLPGQGIKFDLSNISNSEDLTFRLEKLENLTEFAQLLYQSSSTNDYQSPFEKLKSYGPSNIDVEINTLGLEPLSSELLLSQFMKMINFIFMTNKDFELAQSYLSLFLKVHGATVSDSTNLAKFLEPLLESQRKCWERLESSIFYCLGVAEALAES